MPVTQLRQGAAITRRTAQRSLLAMLADLVEGDPTADNERVFRRWLAIAREDEDLLVPALRATFTNLIASLERGRLETARSSASPSQLAANIKDQVACMILMNQVLPSGKLLRDATFKECYEAGSWYVKVSRAGRPDQIVGKTLTEDNLRELLAA